MPSSNDTYQQENLKESVTIPVIEEQVHLDVQKSLTGTVRVSKTVSNETVEVETPYTQENVSVERVPINEYIDELPPAVRYEGEVMIVPVLQEVLVKRTLLIEELRITKTQQTESQTEKITLRKEHVEVQRNPGNQ